MQGNKPVIPTFPLDPGPVVGSAFYSLGGFGLPFFVVGSLGVVIAAVLFYLVPVVPNELRDNENNKKNKIGTGGEEEDEKPDLTVMDTIKVRHNLY